jgi:lipoate-protein ligase A
MLLVDNRSVTNPYINLAIEEFLIRYRSATNNDLLFMYINEPCVVIGKNQSIYREVNFDFLRNSELKLCRRISGGGAVYQDSGNLNFAFISSFAEHKVNNYAWFNNPVMDALRKAGVDAKADARNNIICNGKKISGNAQFTNRKNIISHGTLLLNANLQILRNSLRANNFSIETKAVSSVRSPVENISTFTSMFTSVQQLRNYLVTELKPEGFFQFSNEEWNAITQLASKKFESFEWNYGRSPRTVISKNEIKVEVENGYIMKIEGNYPELNILKGYRYEHNAIKKALEIFPNASSLTELVF